MATLKQTIKYGMLRYPTLFPNPVNVLEHLFCVIGNGYEWIDGELVDRFDRVEGTDKTTEPLTMKYPEEEEVESDLAAFAKYMEKLHTERRLQGLAQRMQMEFVDKHIDEIIEASSTAVYFGSGPRGYYFLKGISIKYSHGINFPDDIKPDWAEGLYEFLEYWLQNLSTEYGPPSKDGDVSHWPADIQEARKALLETRERLHPIVYNGETYQEHK